MDNSMMIAGVGGGGRWRRVWGGQMEMDRDLTCSGEHITSCTEDVLYMCAPETRTV